MIVPLSVKEIRNKAKKPENLWFRIFYYISSFIVWLSMRLHVTPNQLTITGFGINAVGLILFMICNADAMHIFIAVAIFTVAHLFDCADGHLAFVENRQSERGYWMDSTFDIFKIAFIITCFIKMITGTDILFPVSFNIVRIIALVSAQGVLVDYAVNLHAIKYVKQGNSYITTQIDSISATRSRIVRFILSHVREYGNLLLIFALFGVNHNAALMLFVGYGYCHYILAIARIMRISQLI